MKRGTWNLVIAGLMFLSLMAQTGLGLLMKYVLVPGREVWLKYGGRVELTWLGWNRHDWGAVHFYLGWLFLALLVAHLVLNWQMLLALYEKWLPQAGARKLVAAAFGLTALILVYFPALVTPEMREFPGGRGRRLGEMENLPPERVSTPGDITGKDISASKPPETSTEAKSGIRNAAKSQKKKTAVLVGNKPRWRSFGPRARVLVKTPGKPFPRQRARAYYLARCRLP
uniref:DUF4405 domain-containing protein n=1 Tax=Desulfobacca acetoxidans TaxID=60893 RepID=A0A7C5ES39_9BACT